METIKVRSKMTEKNLKNYLLFDQFYGKPYYIKLRALLAVVIGAVTGFFSQDHIGMFVVVTVICLVVLLWFPRMRVGFKAPQIYRRNRSGAFHQAQDFARMQLKRYIMYNRVPVKGNLHMLIIQ